MSGWTACWDWRAAAWLGPVGAGGGGRLRLGRLVVSRLVAGRLGHHRAVHRRLPLGLCGQHGLVPGYGLGVSHRLFAAGGGAWRSAGRCPGWLRVANAVPAFPTGAPDGQTAAAAVAAVATLSALATATMVSLFRFRVMIRRSRDKVTLRSIARGRDRHGARHASPRTTRRL